MLYKIPSVSSEHKREWHLFQRKHYHHYCVFDRNTQQNLNVSWIYKLLPFCPLPLFQHFTPNIATFPIGNNLLTFKWSEVFPKFWNVQSSNYLSKHLGSLTLEFFSRCQQLDLSTLPLPFAFLPFLYIFVCITTIWQLFYFILASSFSYSFPMKKRKLTL